MTEKSEFWLGVKEGMPVIVAAAPIGLLFGALAVENGLTVGQAVLMSAIMFAGASQLVGIELFGQNIVPWLIVFSIFAVNFRHILYSATLGRHLEHFSVPKRALAFFLMTDPQFAISEHKAHLGRKVSFSWYLGLAIPLYLTWVLEAWIGALFGKLISNPEVYGITFLLTIYFLALLMTFRSRSLFLPVVIASALGASASYHYIGSPWHVSLGALCGIIAAACWPTQKAAALDG